MLEVVPRGRQALRVEDFTDDGGEHASSLAEGEHVADVGRLDDREHALLRLADGDLDRRHRRLAQRHAVELDVHATTAVRGSFADGTSDSGRAEVLDAGDESLVVELEAA